MIPVHCSKVEEENETEKKKRKREILNEVNKRGGKGSGPTEKMSQKVECENEETKIKSNKE